MKESRFYRFLKPVIPRPLRPLFLRFQEYISYLVFGVLTTVVNLIIYYPLARVISYLIANVIAWIGAVSFAFIVNKQFVFESHSSSLKALVCEICTFGTARLLSLGLEEGILFVFADCLGCSNTIVKLIAQVVVVVFNYAASKLVIFRKPKASDASESGHS